jgi:hypothetical protein
MRWNLLAAALFAAGLAGAQTPTPSAATLPAPGMTTGSATGFANALGGRDAAGTGTASTGTGATGTGTTGGTGATGTGTTGTGSTGAGTGTTGSGASGTPTGTGTSGSGTGTGTGTGTGSGTTSAPGTPTISTGQQQVAGRVAAPFASFAGSTDNAIALATALRTGTPASLVTTTTDANGNAVTATTTITPPTKPMGWGNVSHALALARVALANAGITEPTSADLQAALVGGDVTNADGKTVTLAGVLEQRAAGMGWGRIAASYGTTIGAVNRGVHGGTVSASTTTPATTTATTAPIKSAPVGTGVTTGATALVSNHGHSRGAGAHGLTTAGGAGAGPKGLTTAAGTPAGVHGAKGITTAGGATSGTTGHAYGRGIVNASGTLPATGAAGGRGLSAGVVSANGASGNRAADHGGKGKGGA